MRDYIRGFMMEGRWISYFYIMILIRKNIFNEF